MPYRPEFASMSDEELITLFQSAAAPAEAATRHAIFTVIVERYQKRIYYAARKMLHGDHDMADEITQDTFVKAYDALASFRGDSKLYTWLYRITLNAVIQIGRKQKVRQMVGLESVEATAEAEDPGPAQQLIGNETTALIEEAIKTLPAKQQRVFLMRFYEELPYEEIAAITGTSVGGLKANYFHAVRKVGDYLKAAERSGSAPEKRLDGSELADGQAL